MNGEGPQVPCLNGIRLMAHAWVIGFHCLKTIGAWERLVRNGDSGIFFILTGLTTELSLSARRDLRDQDTAFLKFLFNYLGHRSLKVFILTWLTAYIAYIIFPIRAGAGQHLLIYVFTGTLPFLERFDKNRIMWNPNPVHWFVCQLLWFWLVHPFLRVPVNMWLQKRSLHLISAGCALTFGCLLLCASLHEYAEDFSGWSFHPLPRFLQYCFGYWLARAVLSTPSVVEVNTARLYFFDYKRVLARHLSDVAFFCYILLQSHGPKRYKDNWNAQWLWRTVGISPLLIMSIYGCYLSKVVVPAKSGSGQLPQSESEAETEVSRDDMDETVKVEITSQRISQHDEVVENLQWIWHGLVRPTTMKGAFYVIFENRFVHKVAPGLTNFLGFLFHFPLVWRPFFGKQPSADGKHSLMYVLTLWLMCLSVNSSVKHLTSLLKRTRTAQPDP